MAPHLPHLPLEARKGKPPLHGKPQKGRPGQKEKGQGEPQEEEKPPPHPS
ncbi:hypothetical protein Thermus77412_11960 [Thermus antranikianii]